MTGVIVVGVHAQILKHIVRHRLDDVSSIKLERKESNACERTNSDINLFHQHGDAHYRINKWPYLPNEALLFIVIPLEMGVPSVYSFICRDGPVDFRILGSIECAVIRDLALSKS